MTPSALAKGRNSRGLGFGGDVPSTTCSFGFAEEASRESPSASRVIDAPASYSASQAETAQAAALFKAG